MENIEIDVKHLTLILSYLFRLEGSKINQNVLDMIILHYPFVAWYLYRFIVGYAGINQLLGIFTTKQNALKAKQEYIAKLEIEGDPKGNQMPYHEVDLEKDVRIEQCDKGFSITSNDDEIYAICYLGYGFGTSHRRIKGWSTRQAMDEIFPDKISEQNQNYIIRVFGSYHVDPLPVDQLRIGNTMNNKFHVNDGELEQKLKVLNEMERFDIVLID